MQKTNKKPLKNEVFEEFSKGERAIIKTRLLGFALERRAKRFFKGLKNKFLTTV